MAINKSLIISGDRVLTYNGSSWINTGLLEPLTKQNYIDYGITTTNIIPQNKWQELDDSFEIVLWTDMNMSAKVFIETSNSYKPIYLLSDPDLLSWSKDDNDLQITITADVDNCSKILVSKDNRRSWYTFKEDTWTQAILNNIPSDGMTIENINGITTNQWDGWFERGYLDFAVWMQKQGNLEEYTLKSITANFPENTPPLLNSFVVTPDNIGRNDIQINMSMQELEGDKFRYKITVNSNILDNISNNGWSEWLSGEQIQNISKTYSYLDFFIGNNDIIITLEDERGKQYIAPTKTIIMENQNPILTTIIHDNWSISGIIEDFDNDKIQYRILINDIQVYPSNSGIIPIYTKFYSVPYALNYEWNSDSLIFNKTDNKITIEIKDEVGGVYTIDYSNLVGKYKNLMFKDMDNTKYFTTDKGQLINWSSSLLSYLDFGILTAGQVTEPVKILLSNEFSRPIENAQVSVNLDTVVGYEVHISKDSSFNPTGVDTLEKLTFDGVMTDGEQKEFYLRISTDVHTTSVGGTFELDTKSDIL